MTAPNQTTKDSGVTSTIPTYSQEEIARCFAAISNAFDHSRSIIDNNPDNWRHQLEAFADAVASEETMEVIRLNGPFAIQSFYFDNSTIPMTKWMLIRDMEDALAFKQQVTQYLAKQPRTGMSTNTAAAIDEAVAQLTSQDRKDICSGEAAGGYVRLVADIITDGQPSLPLQPGVPTRKNELPWTAASAAAENAFLNEVRINMLQVAIKQPESAERLKHTIVYPTGGKTFESSWQDYHNAVRRKLIDDLGAADIFLPSKETGAPEEGETILGLLTPQRTPANGTDTIVKIHS